MNIDEMKDRIARAEEIQRYIENRCEVLEKENAELKAIVRNTKSVDESFALQTIQLTKAKELLEKWVELYKPKLEGYPITPIQEQTEQFLKEIKENE